MLRGRIPPPTWYPEHPETVGDHLRKARLDRGLWQEHVAEEFGVSISTVVNWERNHTKVATRFLPKVMAFLGYDPRPGGRTIGERIRALRERRGLSQKALAEQLGIHASTVTTWERGRVRKPFRTVRRRFEEFLAGG
ncbi:MAG: helix-turn-helix domain-containing protein [Thermoanaerobaculia bacterium]